MLSLIICIGLTSLLFVVFKYYQIFNIPTFQAVVFNYITCGICGLLFTPQADITQTFETLDWLPYSAILGSMFIGTFFLMAITAQKLGMTISATASKISMVIPICFALFLLNKADSFNWINICGVLLAIPTLILTSYNKSEHQKFEKKYLFLVPVVFFLSGGVDSMLNFVNSEFGTPSFQKAFPTITFFIAAFIGISILLFQYVKHHKKIELKAIIGGIALGIPNYFSIYFLFKALSHFDENGAVLFPLTHIGGILLSMLLGFVLFKEKLRLFNYLGVAFALATIYLVAYQHIIVYFGNA